MAPDRYIPPDWRFSRYIQVLKNGVIAWVLVGCNGVTDVTAAQQGIGRKKGGGVFFPNTPPFPAAYRESDRYTVTPLQDREPSSLCGFLETVCNGGNAGGAVVTGGRLIVPTEAA